MSARMRLRRADGAIYLDRWGWECRFGGVFLHRMDAPDPGIDLHDHPWWFVSWVVKGEYVERRIPVRLAQNDDKRFIPGSMRVLGNVRRARWSVRMLGRHEAHTITDLPKGTTWTICLHGPPHKPWGFFTAAGWMPWRIYDETVRAERRDLWAEISNDDRPYQRLKGRAL